MKSANHNELFDWLLMVSAVVEGERNSTWSNRYQVSDSRSQSLLSRSQWGVDWIPFSLFHFFINPFATLSTYFFILFCQTKSHLLLPGSCCFHTHHRSCIQNCMAEVFPVEGTRKSVQIKRHSWIIIIRDQIEGKDERHFLICYTACQCKEEARIIFLLNIIEYPHRQP